MANVFKSWSKDQIKAVWNKGKVMPGCDSDEYRQDIAGAWMKYSEYGNTSHELGLGWEIDHRRPESKGGGDALSNLQPLQWANNRAKSDNYPNWSSDVGSEGNANIYKSQSFTED